jgi:hypothetical protein
LRKQKLGMALPADQQITGVIREDEPQEITLYRWHFSKIFSKAKDIDGRVVPCQQVEASIDEVGGLVTLGVQDILQRGADAVRAGGLDTQHVVTRQRDDVLSLRRGELQCLHDAGECLRGELNILALLKPRVPAHADSSQLRDLLAP